MPRRANIRPHEPGRRRVLEAGRDLFGEVGYDGASIAEVGKRAGVAKSVLYHHFGSKAGLYEAILDVETRDLVSAVAAAVPQDPAAPRLRAGVDAFLRFLAERPATWRLLLRDPPADPLLRKLHAQRAAERSEALARLLASEAKRTGGPHVELVSVAVRVFATWWYEHRDVPQERVAEAIMDVARAGARLAKG